MARTTAQGDSENHGNDGIARRPAAKSTGSKERSESERATDANDPTEAQPLGEKHQA